MRVLLVVSAVVASACGSLATPPSATITNTTPPPAPSSTASQPSSPSASLLSSAQGFITVTEPRANARLIPPVDIGGSASVFEAALQWRIVDSAGRVIVAGNTTASAGAPERGDFRMTASFTQPATDTYATVEVYSRSPKDGNIDEIVRVPVILLGK